MMRMTIFILEESRSGVICFNKFIISAICFFSLQCHFHDSNNLFSDIFIYVVRTKKNIKNKCLMEILWHFFLIIFLSSCKKKEEEEETKIFELSCNVALLWRELFCENSLKNFRMYAYFSLYLNATQSYLEQQREDEKQLFFCAHCEREKK